MIPLLWGRFFEVSYGSTLPGSLLGCLVLAFAHNREGQFKIGRLIIGLIAAFILLARISENIREESFVLPGGVLGFIVMAASGRIGVWLGRTLGVTGVTAKRMQKVELDAQPGMSRFLETSYHAWFAGALDHISDDYRLEAEKLDLKTFISGNAIVQVTEMFEEIEKKGLLEESEYLVAWHKGFVLTNRKLFLRLDGEAGNPLEVIHLDQVRSFEDISTFKQKRVKLTYRNGQVKQLAGMKSLPKQDYVMKTMVSQAELGGRNHSSSSDHGIKEMPANYSRIVERVFWDYAIREGLYEKDQIPSDKEQNARKSCGLSIHQPILGLVDCTVLGSSNNCVLFTPEAMICHNNWTSKSPGIIRVPYNEFPDREFKLAKNHEIDLGQHQFINASGCPLVEEILVNILNDIKGLIVSDKKEVELPGRKTAKSKKTSLIEVNSKGFYDGAPLLLEENPDLQRIFEKLPLIQRPTQTNKDFWTSASKQERRMSLFIGYLQHPDPGIRQETLGILTPGDYTLGVSQLLIDILAADPTKEISQKAAEIIWENEGEVHCKYAVEKLKDEINHGSEQHPVGPTRARKALVLLSEMAPGPKARQMFDQVVH